MKEKGVGERSEQGGLPPLVHLYEIHFLYHTLAVQIILLLLDSKLYWMKLYQKFRCKESPYSVHFKLYLYLKVCTDILIIHIDKYRYTSQYPPSKLKFQMTPHWEVLLQLHCMKPVSNSFFVRFYVRPNQFITTWE